MPKLSLKKKPSYKLTRRAHKHRAVGRKTSRRLRVNIKRKQPTIKYIQLGGDTGCNKTIGAGQFGQAFLCVVDDKPRVVVKKSTVKDASLLNEIEILKKLANPHIVEYISDDDELVNVLQKITGDHYYLEYCDGGSLYDFYGLDPKNPKTKTNPISDKVVEDVYTQIFKGLEYLYSKQIIHSDLKAQNILVKGADGKLTFKIADFGCSVDMTKLLKDSDGNINRKLVFKNGTTIIVPVYLKYSTYFRDLYALYCLIYLLIVHTNFNTKGTPSKTIKDNVISTASQNIDNFIGELFKLEQILMGLEPVPASKQPMNTQPVQNYDTVEQPVQNYDAVEQQAQNYDAVEQHGQNYDTVEQQAQNYDTVESNTYSYVVPEKENLYHLSSKANNKLPVLDDSRFYLAPVAVPVEDSELPPITNDYLQPISARPISANISSSSSLTKASIQSESDPVINIGNDRLLYEYSGIYNLIRAIKTASI